MKKKAVEFLTRIKHVGKTLADEESDAFPMLGRLGEPGLHERNILAALGPERVAFTGDAPEFKGPLVLIGFANRSGSTLLSDYMRQTGAFRGLGEFSNHDFALRQIDEKGLESFPDLIRHLHKATLPRNRAATAPDQIFGFKAAWDQIMMLIRWNIPAMFEGVRIINITRKNILSQAISYSIASQTRQWTSKQEKGEVEPVFSGSDLDKIMREQQSQVALLRHICCVFNLPCQELTYEGLCANPNAHLRSVLAFCGVPRPNWETKSPTFAKQASTTNEAFRRKYQELARERVLKPPLEDTQKG